MKLLPIFTPVFLLVSCSLGPGCGYDGEAVDLFLTERVENLEGWVEGHNVHRKVIDHQVRTKIPEEIEAVKAALIRLRAELGLPQDPTLKD